MAIEALNDSPFYRPAIDHAYKSRMLYSAGNVSKSESLGMVGFQVELMVKGKR